MNTVRRRRSPRAPSIGLDEAIEKAGKIYDKERCHVAPIESVAQHIGYKSAANGAALASIASLKYFGLLERPKEGMLAVSNEFEAFRFAPSDASKRALLVKWLKSPPVFAELLEEYKEGLPSDSNLKFQMIQRGFAPVAADLFIQSFRRSVDFCHYYEQPADDRIGVPADFDEGKDSEDSIQEIQSASACVSPQTTMQPASSTDAIDRIPVRLSGGRRAWIEIPMPLYNADKEHLKKQIDLLLTDDE